jgi:hypothetical protein
MTAMTLQSTYSDKPAIGYQGQLDAGPNDKWTMLNADSVSIPFGTPLAQKPSPTTDLDARIPAASTDQLAGILFRSDGYDPSWTDASGTYGALDSTGVRAGQLIDVLRKGRILVKAQTAVAPGDRLYVSYTTGTTYTAKGQMGNAAESSVTIDATTKGVWKTTATAGSLAWLEVDFTNK